MPPDNRAVPSELCFLWDCHEVLLNSQTVFQGYDCIRAASQLYVGFNLGLVQAVYSSFSADVNWVAVDTRLEVIY